VWANRTCFYSNVYSLWPNKKLGPHTYFNCNFFTWGPAAEKIVIFPWADRIQLTSRVLISDFIWKKWAPHISIIFSWGPGPKVNMYLNIDRTIIFQIIAIKQTIGTFLNTVQRLSVVQFRPFITVPRVSIIHTFIARMSL
jgi:hypothetical protein